MDDLKEELPIRASLHAKGKTAKTYKSLTAEISLNGLQEHYDRFQKETKSCFLPFPDHVWSSFS